VSEEIGGRPLVTVGSRAALRDWLAANHRREEGVWLATWKKPHPEHLPWIEAVAELLCWGWVDAVTRKVDAERSAHLVAPRSPRSAWSALNKRLVEEARAAGAMTPHGEAAIAAAEASGMWTFLDDVEAGVVPDDLAAALGAHRAAWDAWPRSVRRGTLEWIKTARRPETRVRRVRDAAESAAAGLRPAPFRR
jgi:uncharacterized protein YdeI (YjbR/CyaY-like superfamily)